MFQITVIFTLTVQRSLKLKPAKNKKVFLYKRNNNGRL